MNWAAAGVALVLMLGLGAAIVLAAQWVRMCADRWGDRWYGFWLAIGGPLALVAVSMALYAGMLA